MDRVVLADTLAYLPEFSGWYRVITDTLAEIDISRLLIYIVDDVDSVLLPFLAEQFDVLGDKGYRLANNERDRRELIKRAIELHRFKGTEWAVKEALKSIGFTDIEFIKGYDHWAKFGLRITNTNVQLTDESFQEIIRMVNLYKRAACVLMEVRYNLSYDDLLDIGHDDGSVVPSVIADDLLSLSGTLLYDGAELYNGDWDHSGDSDVVNVVVL